MFRQKENNNEMKPYKLISTILIILGLSTILHSQTEVSLSSTEISSLSDLWSLEVNNTGGEMIVGFVSIELRKGNQLVYQARSNSYSFNAGLNVVQMSMVQPIQVQRDEVGVLEGEYNLDTKLIDAQSQQVRFVDRLKVNGMNASDENIDRAGDGRSIFELSGYGGIYTQISDRQGVGSELPRNHLRAELHPDVSIHGIPVGIDALYSTEQNAFRQSMNQISFRFDVQEYKKQMQSQWKEKIKDIERSGDLLQINQLQSIKDKAMDKKFPKLKEWEATLADPNIKNGLAAMKQYEDLDNVLKSKEIQANLSRYKVLAAKKHLTEGEAIELSSLEAFNTEINKLQTKKETLVSTSKQYKKYAGLSKKIKKAKRYIHTGLKKDAGLAQSGMKSFGLMSKTQQWLSGIEALELGTSYPYYSRLSMSSLSVNGVHIEWNPGPIYIAATYGQSARQTYNTEFVIPDLNLAQKTFATKLGYGSPYGNHFHLVYISIKDKVNSLSLDNPTKPQSNNIFGIDGQVSIFSDKVKIGGELMSSLLTRDHTIVTKDGNEFDRSVIPLNGLFGNINASSSYDIAWRAFTDVKFFGNNTKVKASMERVGPNYYSLGSPTLLNDLLRWKAELRQSFFKHRLSVSAFARQDANNLNPLLTTNKTSLQSYGLSTMLHFPKFPSMMFSYAPYSQKSELINNNTTQESNADILNITISYPYSLGKGIRANTQVNYINQSLSSTIPDINYGSTLYGINQNLSYKNYGANIAYTFTPNQVIEDITQDVSTLNVTGQIAQNKWRANLGVQLLSIANTETKTGFYGTVDYQIIKNLNLTLRAQRNIYESQFDNNLTGFSDYVINTGLVYNFDYKSKGRKKKTIQEIFAPIKQEEPIVEIAEEPSKIDTIIEKKSTIVEDSEVQKEIAEKIIEPIESVEKEPILKEKPLKEKRKTFEELVTSSESKNQQYHFKVFFTKDSPNKAFISLMNIGPVNSISVNNGQALYYIQTNKNEEKAKTIHQKLLSKGYNKTMVVEYNKGEQISTKNNIQLEKEKIIQKLKKEKLKQSTCAIIIHSIRDRRKANSIARKLERDGYVSFQEKNGRFNRVGIKVHCNDPNNKLLLKEIKKKYNKEAWLRK